MNPNVNVNRPPTTNVQVRRPHAATTAGRFRSATRVPDLPVLNNLRITSNTGKTNVDDSSSSDEDFRSTAARPQTAQRPAHRRSMSHPFPSLFSSKKKKTYQMYAGDSESETVDEAGYAPKLGTIRPPTQQPRGHRNVPSTGNKDYSTGNCMTCGSLVRWPRELSVFKCTICLTVNDLQPTGSAQGQGQGPRRDASRNSPPAAEERAFSYDRPVSLGHTKSLASQCLRSFLSSALRSKLGRSADVQPDSYFTLAKVPSRDQHENPMSPPRSPGRGPPANRPVGVSSQPQRDGLTVPNTYLDPQRRSNGTSRSYSSSYPEKRPSIPDLGPQAPPQVSPQIGTPEIDSRRMFKRLEDYIVSCFTSYQCLNTSFSTTRQASQPRPTGEPERRRRPTQSQPQPRPQPPPMPQPEARKDSVTADHSFPEMDAKMLLLGDFAENGLWWTGGHEEVVPGRSSSNRSDPGASAVSPRSPRIDWAELEEWYTAVLDAVRAWPLVYDELVSEDSTLAVPPEALKEIEAQLLVGQDHVHRSLLKASETIMKRPGRPLTAPHELRFILILAANPLLHTYYKPYPGEFRHMDAFWSSQGGPSSGRHSGIIKRIVGLLSNTPNECHNHLVNWFARYPEPLFIKTKDLISSFLAFRLNRQNEKKYDAKVDITAGLIPSLNAGRSAASLHAALGSSQASGKKQKEKKKIYNDDWQIKASAQVLALIFAANNTGHSRRSLAGSRTDGPAASSTRDRVQMRGQILATSDFYTTLLDDSDLVADFETWESKKGKFAFCQFPFLLSIGAKIQILEYDARRQMEDKARDAFFNSILTHRVIQQHLVLNVRRDCLVDDSLKAVSEVIGSGGEDIKKGLKINFKGEEGIDAGGLRKEWFLLLVREVFNPDHGMFVYDEDSQYCYFNPASLEPSEQYFLVGVVFGLAIYNSTILDVALPPFAFRKLLMAAPPPTLATSQPRQPMTYTLDDLAEYRPRLASGLRQLLEFDSDVESTFCLDFIIDIERYGTTERVSLCPNGDRRPVTNANRREYVDLYVRYLLDTAVTRQFEPFKRGFYTVCGGNALSLFRPEEIELLVRGSDESLDISALKSAATYDNWNSKSLVENDEEPMIKWFWELFEEASPQDQRKLLLFITGSDRIPAGGAAALSIRISCLGEDCGRYPTARTCFNSLALWRYASKEELKGYLWRAVWESEGFGLK